MISQRPESGRRQWSRVHDGGAKNACTLPPEGGGTAGAGMGECPFSLKVRVTLYPGSHPALPSLTGEPLASE